MDHGNPTVVGGATCWFVSDEHITFAPDRERPVAVGDGVRVLPAHVDPTVAMHERIGRRRARRRGDDRARRRPQIVDAWPVDLRGW